MPTDDRRERNIFSSLVTYAPVVGGVLYGLRGMRGELASLARKPSETSKIMGRAGGTIASSMKSRTAVAQAAVEDSLKNGSVNMQNALRTAMGNMGGPDAVRRLAMAYAATVSDPALSLSKTNVAQSLLHVQNILTSGVVQRDQAAFVTSMSNLFNRLPARALPTLLRKFN